LIFINFPPKQSLKYSSCFEGKWRKIKELMKIKKLKLLH